MSRTVGVAVALTALVATAVHPPTAAAERQAAAPTTLHFRVPDGHGGSCDVVGDLYRPAGASRSRPVPAVMGTNGFAGSKDDLAPMAEMFAARGYAVLAYSGLGFGGSSCRVTLDSPTPDGRAASTLIGYLGGASGIAYTDAGHRTTAPPVDFVIRDDASEGRVHDPRVGMFGGSYGGAVQFAAAATDPRLDAIVPMATWNDLSYSIVPNNTGQTSGVTTSAPGAFKLNWGVTFAAAGVAAGVAHATVTPDRLTGCPNFPREVCDGIAQGVATGVPSRAVVDRLRSASVSTYIDRVRTPTLLVQGEQDTLFNLNESSATYAALAERGVPTQLIWYSGGHSGTAATGDIDESAPDPRRQYVTGRIVEWFDTHLKRNSAPGGPTFSYYRPWADRGDARAAYAFADSVAAPDHIRLAFSGTNALVSDRSQTRPGRARLTTPAIPIPAGSDAADGIGVAGATIDDDPGTFVRWTSARLTDAIDVVGSPSATLSVDARENGRAVRRDSLVLFLKVVDVAPNGTATTVGDLVAPARIGDPARPFTVTMPAVAHRFGAGHRVRLVIAGNSSNYRPGEPSASVSIPASGGSLTLPVRS
ncbi:hypothetical protein GCM10023197_44800 [Gordonia humi]